MKPKQQMIRIQDWLGHKPADLVIQPFSYPDSEPFAYLIYLSSIIDLQKIHTTLVEPLHHIVSHMEKDNLSLKNTLVALSSTGVQIPMKQTYVLEALFQGNALLLTDNSQDILSYPSAKWADRSITAPDRENTVTGPQDGFIENIDTNLSMIRRRYHHKSLVVHDYVIGSRSKSRVKVIYIDDRVNEGALKKIEERIQKIEIDVVHDTNQIAELISDLKLSPFPLHNKSERPDTVVSSLLRGSIVTLMDTSPSAVILPATFIGMLQAADDHYFPSMSGSFIRLIRFIGLLVGLLLPSLYIAFTSVNHNVLRVQFMLAIAASREGVPYPAVFEVIIMLSLLELINEASVRLPKIIAGTATIVGGLLIGSASAQSHLISNIMIVVTAATAIGSYSIPNYMLAVAWRYCSYTLALLSTLWGLSGLTVGIAFLILYLCHLSSLGVPYLSPLSTFYYKDLIRDALTKLPLQWSTNIASSFSKKAGGQTRLTADERKQKL